MDTESRASARPCNPGAERIRRGRSRAAVHQPAERFTVCNLSRQAAQDSQMAHNLGRFGRFELVVDVRVQQAADLEAYHDGSSVCAADGLRIARSRSRARAKRDMTVPIGIPVTAASLLVREPSISRSTMTSRKSAGSALTAR